MRKYLKLLDSEMNEFRNNSNDRSNLTALLLSQNLNRSEVTDLTNCAEILKTILRSFFFP